MKVKFLAAATGATMKGGSKELGEYLISLRDAQANRPHVLVAGGGE